MSEQEGEYGLIMPFVIVKSQGGPYDDAAFTAGMTCGQFWAELQGLSTHGATPRPRFVRPEYLPQLDLIAMHFGYTIKAGETDEASGYQRIDFGPEYDEPGEATDADA